MAIRSKQYLKNKTVTNAKITQDVMHDFVETSFHIEPLATGDITSTLQALITGVQGVGDLAVALSHSGNYTCDRLVWNGTGRFSIYGNNAHITLSPGNTDWLQMTGAHGLYLDRVNFHGNDALQNESSNFFIRVDTDSGSGNCVINKCRFHNIRNKGIEFIDEAGLQGWDRIHVVDCDFSGIGTGTVHTGNAIRFYYDQKNVLVEDCTFTDVGFKDASKTVQFNGLVGGGSGTDSIGNCTMRNCNFNRTSTCCFGQAYKQFNVYGVRGRDIGLRRDGTSHGNEALVNYIKCDNGGADSQTMVSDCHFMTTATGTNVPNVEFTQDFNGNSDNDTPGVRLHNVTCEKGDIAVAGSGNGHIVTQCRAIEGTFTVGFAGGRPNANIISQCHNPSLGGGPAIVSSCLFYNPSGDQSPAYTLAKDNALFENCIISRQFDINGANEATFDSCVLEGSGYFRLVSDNNNLTFKNCKLETKYTSVIDGIGGSTESGLVIQNCKLSCSGTNIISLNNPIHINVIDNIFVSGTYTLNRETSSNDLYGIIARNRGLATLPSVTNADELQIYDNVYWGVTGNYIALSEQVSGVYNVDDLGTLTQWHESDSTGTILVEANAVSGWNNNVNGGVNFSQAATANRPTWDERGWDADAQGAIKFETNDYLVHSGSVSETEGHLALSVRLPETLSNEQVLVATSDEGTNNNYLELGINAAGNVYVQSNDGGSVNHVTSATTLTGVYKYNLQLNSDGSEWQLRINGTADPLTVVSGSNNGHWFGDVTGADNVALGAKFNSDGVLKPFAGWIARYLQYSDSLSEINQTKLWIDMDKNYNEYPVVVSTASGLVTALDNQTVGTHIRMMPGTYSDFENHLNLTHDDVKVQGVGWDCIVDLAYGTSGAVYIQPQAARNEISHFRVYCSHETRDTPETGSFPGLDRGRIHLSNADDCLIHTMLIHDLSQGIGHFRSPHGGGRVHGCVIYNNGWYASNDLRNHGQGFYMQNDWGRKIIDGNINWGDFHISKIYGTANARLNEFTLKNNAFQMFLVGGGSPYRKINIEDNIFEYCETAFTAGLSNEGIWKGNKFFRIFNIINGRHSFFDNEFYAGANSMGKITAPTSGEFVGHIFDRNDYHTTASQIWVWEDGALNVSGNYTFAQWQGIGNDLNGNHYSSGVNPVHIKVWPNDYVQGHGNVVILNANSAQSVGLETILTVGDEYEILSAHNPTGIPEVTGIYDGNPVTLNHFSAVTGVPIGDEGRVLLGSGTNGGPQEIHWVGYVVRTV